MVDAFSYSARWAKSHPTLVNNRPISKNFQIHSIQTRSEWIGQKPISRYCPFKNEIRRTIYDLGESLSRGRHCAFIPSHKISRGLRNIIWICQICTVCKTMKMPLIEENFEISNWVESKHIWNNGLVGKNHCSLEGSQFLIATKNHVVKRNQTKKIFLQYVNPSNEPFGAT